MSHFTVLVIGGGVEEQLYPFWELDLSPEDMAEDPRAEFEIEIARDDIPAKAKEVAESYITWLRGENVKYGKQKASGKYKEAVESMLHGGFGYEEKDYVALVNRAMQSNREDMRKYREYLNAENWTAILSDYKGGGQNENGHWGYWHNPKAKWDWFQVGGRWRGYFHIKLGCVGTLGEPSWYNEGQELPPNRADQALKVAIDWESMKAEGRTNGEKWWDEHLGKLKSGDSHYSPYFDYRIRKEDTRESYIQRQESVATFAVVKDGEWYEHGKMGWFACVSDEKPQDQWEQEFEKLVMSLPDDKMLTIVDCHI